MADPPAAATVTTTATATANPGEKPVVSLSTVIQEAGAPADGSLESPGASAPAAKRAKVSGPAEVPHGGVAPLVSSTDPAQHLPAGPTLGSDAPGAFPLASQMYLACMPAACKSCMTIRISDATTR